MNGNGGLNGNGGFMLSGKATEDGDLASYVRNATGSDQLVVDFVVNSHLITQGENWTLKVRFIRTIDAKCLAYFSYDFAEGAFHTAEQRAAGDIKRVLVDEAGVGSKSPQLPGLERPTGQEFDHYLFRMEQGLAIRCLGIEGTSGAFLSNPAEIIGGMIHLCLQNPEHLSSRVLLCQSLKNLQKHDPELVKSYQQKINDLQNDFPLNGAVHDLLSHELKEVLK